MKFITRQNAADENNTDYDIFNQPDLWTYLIKIRSVWPIDKDREEET